MKNIRRDILRHFQSISTRSKSTIGQNGANTKFVCPKNPRLNSIIVKQRISILEEIGLTPNDSNLFRFAYIFKTDLGELKSNDIIQDTDVHNRLLNYLEPFDYKHDLRCPEFSTISQYYKPIKQYYRHSVLEKQAVFNWPDDVPEETENTVSSAIRRVMRQYYRWRLEVDFFTIDQLMYNYSKVTGVRSVRSLKQTLDILEKKLNFPKSKIVRNFFVMSIAPERLEDVIEKCPTIGSCDIKVAANLVPKILAKSSTEIRAIEKIVKEFGVCDSAMQDACNLQIYTLRSSSVRKRMEAIKNSELSVFVDHPRIGEMVCSFQKAYDRMNELQNRGIKCVSFNVLTANESIFLRYLNDGVDRTHMMRDVILYLSQKLNVPEKVVAKKIDRHPFRFFIPLKEVKETLSALFDAGFSNEVILDSLQIVFYAREKVLATLDMIVDDDELKELGFDKGFVQNSNSLYPSCTKHDDRRLLLCLYYMEKPFHFTGEGALRVEHSNL